MVEISREEFYKAQETVNMYKTQQHNKKIEECVKLGHCYVNTYGNNYKCTFCGDWVCSKHHVLGNQRESITLDVKYDKKFNPFLGGCGKY